MLAFATAHAGNFDFDDFTLAVPDAYQGPQTISPMPNVLVHGRTDFKASEPREIQIAGQPAVDIEWTGNMNDIATRGRLFVMIHQATAYFFQIMGAAPPTKDMDAAIEAVKELRKKP